LLTGLEVAAALCVTAVAIKLNRLARTFARRTAILSALLGWTRTNRVFALFLLVVCHGILLKIRLYWADSSTKSGLWTFDETKSD
jgi:hypothetical protein